MTRSARVVVALLAALSAPAAAAPETLFVVATCDTSVFRLLDLNGDGDALDLGEVTLWGLTGGFFASEIVADGDVLYATRDGFGAVVRFEDVNGDGDALDVGEMTEFVTGLTSPRGLARGAGGEWYISEFFDDRVLRVEDLNGDGDADDVGEQTLYAQPIVGAGALLLKGDDLFVTAFKGGPAVIRRLRDLNGDNDALDVGENVIYADWGGNPRGLFDDGDSLLASENDADAVYRVADLNGDGDALDVLEAMPISVLPAGTGPWGLAQLGGDGIGITGRDGDEIFRIKDVNGDGDAFDIGEVLLFADAIFEPGGIVALEDTCPWDCGDGDGMVGIVDFLAVLAQWGMIGSSCDFDGSGVGINQFLELLGHWGPCP
jgi:hypothetical protein